MNKGKTALIGTLALVAMGCAKKDGDNRLRERAQIEQEQQTDVERRKLQERAAKMEVDLADRHFFYRAIEGEYTGPLTVDSINYKVRFTFVRSLPPYTGSRIREISEVESDLNNLYLNMQVVQWHPDDPSSAVGCRVTGIRPNMEEGGFIVASSDCPNLYTVLLSEGGPRSFRDKKQRAQDLAESIRNRTVENVTDIIGYVQPSSISAKYPFAAKKVN